MTTINGVTFNMKTLEPISTHRNIPNEEIGTDESFITDMGYTGLVLRMTGYENTLAKYDEVINEFHKPGAHTLVYRTGWQFTIYSTQLVPMLGIGIVDNFFPYELIMLTSNPYRESTTLSCRAKEITANNEEWSVEDIPCDNLIAGWGFEDWSLGDSSAPDGWTIGSGSISKEITIVQLGSFSAKLTSANGYIYQYIASPEKYRGSKITFGCWIRNNTGNVSSITITDSGGSSSEAHNSPGSWAWVTVTRTIDSAATYIRISCGQSYIAATGYFDCAVVVEGDSIPDNTFIRDIDTDGSVDAVPDIQVTGGVSGTDVNISQLTSNTSIEITSVHTAGQTFIPAGDTLKNIYVYVSGLTDPPVTATLRVFDSVAMTNELGSKTQVLDVPNNTFTFDPPIDIGNKDLMYFRFDTVTGAKEARFYMSTANPYSGGAAYLDDVIQAANDFKFKTFTAQSIVKDAEIYNIVDTTIKCAVTNDMLYEAIHRINTDGTGTVEYNEDFSTGKHRYDGTNVNCSCDHINNELDIADDGYIYWKCDVKYPITGIPTLTSTVNITSGLPTIQISSDGTTWYDIDTAIVDDVETVYALDSASLHIKESGLTEVYWRYDCVKAAAATCSIKNFRLHVDFVTIDVEHPKISSTGVSTVRCDQHADSGLNCVVALKYRDRSWPA